MFGLDRRVVWGILLACALLVLILSGEIWVVILSIPGVIIAMTFHEFAHAWAADKLGDSTPRMQGRLNLNPLSHLDPLGFILLLFVHIGWGKPVEINPLNFNGNKSMETSEALVALAGPVMNFILAFISLFVYYALFLFTNCGETVLEIVFYIVSMNIGLGVFNLIPIPPLDGSKIFRKFLPYKFKDWLDRNMKYIYLIFLVLWIFGILGYLVSPVINVVYKGMSWVVWHIFMLFV